MQRFILGKKNQIALISAILIVLGFFSHFVLKNTTHFQLVIHYRFHSWSGTHCDSGVSSFKSKSGQY